MCTVSLVPLNDADKAEGFMLIANRDEQRSRPPARAPIEFRLAGRRVFMPIDPVGGGSWIAVNEAAVALTMLNVNPATPPRPDPAWLSRGRIVVDLADAVDLAQVDERMTGWPAERYAPFRLVAAARRRVHEYRSDGRHLTRRSHPLDRPLMFTSSGLGDPLVEQPRRQLFDQMFADVGPADWPAVQRRFHQHRWADRPEQSVCMSRPDARTVSWTVVRVVGELIEMIYHGDSPDRPVEPVVRQWGGV